VRHGGARLIEAFLQLLDPPDQLVFGFHVAYARAVGVCITFRTRPPPVYM
jgi:hypothetical protein